jgi:hypothetical protein
MDREDLHDKLVEILGSNYVYFQPPETVRLTYPCIIYKRSGVDSRYADDSPYTLTKLYMVTVIDTNPDSLIPDKIGALSNCSFRTHFTKDNLNHDVYNLYY